MFLSVQRRSLRGCSSGMEAWLRPCVLGKHFYSVGGHPGGAREAQARGGVGGWQGGGPVRTAFVFLVMGSVEL